MKLRSLMLTVALLVPSVASAEPITFGVWSQVPTADGDGVPFWDGASWDCATCGVGYLLHAYENAGLEYLHDGAGKPVGFRFDDPVIVPTLLYHMTAWTAGVFGRRVDGAFTYDSGTGRVSNSFDNGEQYVLFRHVGTETTEYFLGIEDILLSERLNDRDYNDYVMSATLPTQPVPEPSTLLLLGMSTVGFVGRRLRRQTVPVSSPC